MKCSVGSYKKCAHDNSKGYQSCIEKTYKKTNKGRQCDTIDIKQYAIYTSQTPHRTASHHTATHRIARQCIALPRHIRAADQ